MQLTSTQIDNLSKRLENNVPEIRFAYLFGSSIKGSSNDNSDVDVAIYLDASQRNFDVISRILEACEDAIPGYTADLTLLNESNVNLAMEALKGRILFIREDSVDFHAEFYSITCRKYEDEMAWMKRQLIYRNYEVQWGD